MRIKNISLISLAAILSSSAACGPDVDPLYCLSEAPSNETLQPYIKNFEDNPHIPESFGFCHLPREVRFLMWNKIEEAEESRNSIDGVLPEEFNHLEKGQNSISVTRNEAYEIYSSHLAHRFWLDQNGLVPWKLADYGREDLQRLLSPVIFSRWDDAAGIFSFNYLVDHSPADTFSIAQEIVDLDSLTDQKSAIIEFTKAFREYRHGSAWNLDDLTDDDPKEINTMLGMSEEKISRSGCQSMSIFMVQLAGIYNIPGVTIKGYYAGDWHRSALFPFTNQVAAHGDVFYDSNLDNVPSSELLDDYDFWKESVLAYPKLDPVAAHNSLVNSKENSMKYPSANMIYHYCKLEGKDYLYDLFIGTEFGDFATLEQIDKLEEKILEMTDNCEEDIDNTAKSLIIPTDNNLYGRYEHQH